MPSAVLRIGFGGLQGDVLHQEDFNAICHFGKLISSRPQGELISHEVSHLGLGSGS